MKKALLLLVIILIGGTMYSQDSTDQKLAPKDSITILDVQKHIFLTARDIYQYNLKCYQDSISVQEFYGKALTSEFWRNKGRHYWDPFEPLPQNRAIFLHWRPTMQGFIEFMDQKYRLK